MSYGADTKLNSSRVRIQAIHPFHVCALGPTICLDSMGPRTCAAVGTGDGTQSSYLSFSCGIPQLRHLCSALPLENPLVNPTGHSPIACMCPGTHELLRQQ
jgi:hypothetical protein